MDKNFDEALEGIMEKHGPTFEKLANQEINEQVARKLGHWGACSCNGHHYCEDISAAWAIVEAWKPPYKEQLFTLERDVDNCPEWEASFGLTTASANSAPLAICKAFLKLP